MERIRARARVDTFRVMLEPPVGSGRQIAAVRDSSVEMRSVKLLNSA
jgi:hypothetical protein